MSNKPLDIESWIPHFSILTNYLIKKDRNVFTNWNRFSEDKIKPDNEDKDKLSLVIEFFQAFGNRFFTICCNGALVIEYYPGSI